MKNQELPGTVSGDRERKEFFKQFILSIRPEAIVDIPADQYCTYDVRVTYNNTVASACGCVANKINYYELKNRTVKSTDYGDSIIEEGKYNHLKELQSENADVYVVNIFTDNVMYIIPLESEHEIQEHYCKRTSWWNTNKISKKLVSYKHKDEYKFEF